MKLDIKTLLIFFLFFISCQKSSDIKGVWKNCGDDSEFSDILVFDDLYNFVKNDTVFTKKDSAIATIQKISFEYGEKKLYLKSINNHKIYRFCKK